MTQSGPTTFDPLAVAQQTLDTPLSRILADRIQREGPITFADWMEACLYHSEHGYYRRGQPTVGREGDFLTSPEVHPLFGAARSAPSSKRRACETARMSSRSAFCASSSASAAPRKAFSSSTAPIASMRGGLLEIRPAPKRSVCPLSPRFV